MITLFILTHAYASGNGHKVAAVMCETLHVSMSMATPDGKRPTDVLHFNFTWALCYQLFSYVHKWKERDMRVVSRY